MKNSVIKLIIVMILVTLAGVYAKNLETKATMNTWLDRQTVLIQQSNSIRQKETELNQLKEENNHLKTKLQTQMELDMKIANSPDVKAKTLRAAIVKFGYDQIAALEELINHESHFNPMALNPTSGACGIFQALPCSKLPSLDVDTQISWGLSYIQKRYKNPSNALAFWIQNKVTTGNGWY